MLVIKQHDCDQLALHCRSCLPNEACGLIAGSVCNDRCLVEQVYFLSNVDQSPEHFSLDPREQLDAIRHMRENGWSQLGNFHSHPDTPARMSDEDIRLAHDKSARYLILSLKDRNAPVLKTFVFRNGSFMEEAIEVT